MAESNTPKYTFEELEEKAGLALLDPKLVEMVKNAPSTSKSSVNLSWTRKRKRCNNMGVARNEERRAGACQALQRG